MKKKYSQNHKAVTFKIDQVIILYIPKKNHATTDNYQLLCMIKEILYKGRYKLQTKFGILDWLYSTSELNVISSANEEAY